jgi:RNA polymerase sigma factor (sigma-70 family)
LLKNSTGADIVSAIHAALKGNTYLSPSISRRVIEEYISMKSRSSIDELFNTLSNREREVFQMIAEGHATRQIAEILCVSVSTIKSHRAKIMEKLQVDNIAQLIQFAIRLGIVDIQS